MEDERPIVYIVDDDSAVRTAVGSLIRSVGLRVQGFASGTDFLHARRSSAPECLLLDVRMPGLSGLDLQIELAKAHLDISIVFITGHGDIPMAVRGMKAGAIEFLTKPFRDQDLLDAIQLGIERSRLARQRHAESAELSVCLTSLTPREAEVMERVVSGALNKQIAAELGTSEKTIKVHRGKVMRKMHARSLPDLVRMVQRRDCGAGSRSLAAAPPGNRSVG